MQSWTLFVLEEAVVDGEIQRKAAELGLDAGIKVHTLEGVECHWKIDRCLSHVPSVDVCGTQL